MTPDAESIAVTPDALAMRVGETARLEVSVLPAEASQEFTATVSDPTIASVEEPSADEEQADGSSMVETE